MQLAGMSMKFEVFGIHTPLITENDNLVDVLLTSLQDMGLTIEDNDIVVVASSVVSLVEKRKVKVSEIKPSQEAIELGEKYKIDPKFMQLIIDESSEIIGKPKGLKGFLLTIRKGIPCVNACIDMSNVPQGYYLLPPKDPMISAKRIREEIKKRTGKKVAVIIADSGILPSKKGTVGVALGFSGIKPVRNYVGKKDLYGRVLKVSRQSMVDLLASVAEIVMGEADERIPFALIRGVPAEFTDEDISLEESIMPPNECMFMSIMLSKVKEEEQ